MSTDSPREARVRRLAAARQELRLEKGRARDENHVLSGTPGDRHADSARTGYGYDLDDVEDYLARLS